MALNPIAKGVVVTVQTEQFTTKQRSEKSHFRFSSAMDNMVYRTERIDPAGTMTLTPTPTPIKYLCIRAVTGKISVSITNLDNTVYTLVASPLLILTGITASSITITNTDAVGLPEKDVTAEYYI